jgi:hypothetical protein
MTIGRKADLRGSKTKRSFEAVVLVGDWDSEGYPLGLQTDVLLLGATLGQSSSIKYVNREHKYTDVVLAGREGAKLIILISLPIQRHLLFFGNHLD